MSPHTPPYRAWQKPALEGSINPPEGHFERVSSGALIGPRHPRPLARDRRQRNVDGKTSKAMRVAMLAYTIMSKGGGQCRVAIC